MTCVASSGGQKDPTTVSSEVSSDNATDEAMRVSQFSGVGFFFYSHYFLSFLLQIHVESAKIKSCPIYFFNCRPLSFYWFFFVLFFFNFISFHLILFNFYINYRTHSFDCYFFYPIWVLNFLISFLSFLIFFFNFVPQHFISFIFYPNLVLILLIFFFILF